MSVDVWICSGIGLRESAIRPHLNMSKCREEIEKQLPGENIPRNRFDIDDYLQGEPFYGLGDFLTHLDDTNTLSYGDNGNGETFFYYERLFPWEHAANEPKSIDEVRDRIIDAVSRVCDLSRDEIDELIDDDIYEQGWG